MRTSCNKQGFSLVEMSIILTMFSVMMASMLSDTNQKRIQASYVNTQQRMEKVADALENYMRYHGNLPCPASLSSSRSNIGKSVATCQIANPDLTDEVAGVDLLIASPNDQYKMWVGMLPARELGLTEQDTVDEWDRRITYVMLHATGSNLGYRNYVPTQTTDYPEIWKASIPPALPTLLIGSSPTQIPAFILISHGIDGKGGYTKEGQLFSPCGSSSDSENCNVSDVTNKSFRLSHFVTNVPETGTAYYHDLVVWRALPH